MEHQSKREELISKFFRNLNLIVDVELCYMCYCDISDTWDEFAFLDSNITHRQYYQTLQQISNQEYSEEQCEAIKTAEIHKDAVVDYINSLDIQFENLKILSETIKFNEDKILGSL